MAEKGKGKSLKKVRVTLVRGRAGKKRSDLKTLDCLRLRKRGASAVFEATPTIMGMINKVAHLVKVEEIENA